VETSRVSLCEADRRLGVRYRGLDGAVIPEGRGEQQVHEQRQGHDDLVESRRYELASALDLRLGMRQASDLRCLPTSQPMVTCSDSEVGQP